MHHPFLNQKIKLLNRNYMHRRVNLVSKHQTLFGLTLFALCKFPLLSPSSNAARMLLSASVHIFQYISMSYTSKSAASSCQWSESENRADFAVEQLYISFYALIDHEKERLLSMTLFSITRI